MTLTIESVTLFAVKHLVAGADILVTAFFIYAIIMILRKMRSLFIFRGIALFTAIYILGVIFGLQLTTVLFRGFFSFFMIIVVVLFQKELRKFFENLSIDFLSPFRKTPPPLRKETVSTIIDSVKYMTSRKIGALIVITGKQHLERYLEGGYLLGGRISSPLILSIFNNKTPGHDGALILDGNRAQKFGVHLPLAENFKRYGNIGTRHRAGLGISELSDALTIIASEERGTITIGRAGNLHVATLPELEKELSAFVDEVAPEEKFSLIKTILEDKRDKILSLALATVLWLVLVNK